MPYPWGESGPQIATHPRERLHGRGIDYLALRLRGQRRGGIFRQHGARQREAAE
jgi:hypothetical protein